MFGDILRNIWGLSPECLATLPEIEFTYGRVDFLTVSETKLDSSFPTGQFNLPGFRTPYRKDLSAKSGGLLVYVNSNIPSKVLKIPDCPSDIQVIPFEINLKKKNVW